MPNLSKALILAGLLGAAVPAHAFFEANVTGGYTLLNPTDLNDLIVKSAGPGNTSTQVTGGYYVAVDAGVSLFPLLKISPRVEYVKANQGASGSNTVDMNVVPMELGLSFDQSLPLTGLSVRVGAWGGYGFGVVTTAGPGSNNLYQGGAFTAEAVAALRYKIAPFLSLGLEAGYRLARFAEMKDSAGEPLQKSATESLVVDLSGANLGGGLTFNF